MSVFSNYLGFLAHNIGQDLRLPEYNVSERLGFNVPVAKAAEPVRTTTNTPLIQNAINNASKNIPVINNPNNVLGANTTGGGNPGTPVNSTPPGQDILRNDIQQQTDAGNNIIDRDFEQALSELGSQESNLRGQAGLSEQQVKQQGEQAKTTLQEGRDVNLQGLDREAQTAQTQASSAMQQARDLYRQMQQQNIAQLSATGLSSSSVAEALSERLGVETARRIAGVTGSRDEIIQNIERERTRINTVFQTKKQQLEESVGMQIAQIQQSLMQGLDTINNARRAAANDKASARERLLSSAQSQVAQLQAQQQQFQQQLQEAAARRTQAVTESLNLLTATPQDFNQLTSNIQSIAPALQGTGLDFGINVNQKGQPTFQFSSPVKNEEDDLEALLSGI